MEIINLFFEYYFFEIIIKVFILYLICKTIKFLFNFDIVDYLKIGTNHIYQLAIKLLH